MILASVCTGCHNTVGTINGLWCPVVRKYVQYAARHLCETTDKNETPT